MKKRLTRISPNQTAWTLSMVYLILGAIFWIIFAIVNVAMGQDSINILFGLIAVVLYPLFAYVFGLIACAFYNLIAKITGGIEFTLKDKK